MHHREGNFIGATQFSPNRVIFVPTTVSTTEQNDGLPFTVEQTFAEMKPFHFFQFALRCFLSSDLFSCFSCPPDDLGFSSFAAAAASANPSTPFSSMPYLKTSPYLMVDPLHSMGYSAASELQLCFPFILNTNSSGFFFILFGRCMFLCWFTKLFSHSIDDNRNISILE